MIRVARKKGSQKKPPLWSGKRFEMLTRELEKKGAKNPEALAAWIGRKKYGRERFQKAAAAARRSKTRGK